jgi:tetratricopeptide (TPR) repeat protein
MPEKKSRKPASAPKQRKTAKRGQLPPGVDPAMYKLAQVLRRMAAASPGQQEAFLAALSNRSAPIPLEPELTPQEQAQELSAQATEAPTKARALALTRRALALDPDCVDALTNLAALASKTPEQAIEGLRVAVVAGERKLGVDFFHENKGYFWGLHETRPYMRARYQLADMLLAADRYDEAIRHLEAMLELNPNDNQGVREILLGACLTTSNLEGVRRVLTAYANDSSAVFAWARVIERLLSQQPKEAEVALAKARKANRFVELYLTGGKRLPRTMPDMYSPGSIEEAQLCLETLSGPLAVHRESLFWIMERLFSSIPQHSWLF